MRPVSPRFIACTSSPDEAQIVFFGVPFEGTVNLRKGADAGPRDLRIASDSIETYSPILERDLEDLHLADIGDCELPDGATLAPSFPDLTVLQFDAHPDLREEFLGERYNYASAMARVMDTVPLEALRGVLPSSPAGRST